MRILIHWLLVWSLALGAPVASCCQWGLLARSAVATLSSVHDSGRCCCEAVPAQDSDRPGDEGTRCTCGPSKRLFAGIGSDRAGALNAVAVIPPAWGWGAGDSSSHDPVVVGRGCDPPVVTLLRLHCALTI